MLHYVILYYSMRGRRLNSPGGPPMLRRSSSPFCTRFSCRLYMCIYVCVHIYIYIYTCIHAYTYIYIYIYIYMYIHTHIYIHIHTYTYTHIHIHTHIHINIITSHRFVVDLLAIFYVIRKCGTKHLSKWATRDGVDPLPYVMWPLV